MPGAGLSLEKREFEVLLFLLKEKLLPFEGGIDNPVLGVVVETVEVELVVFEIKLNEFEGAGPAAFAKVGVNGNEFELAVVAFGGDWPSFLPKEHKVPVNENPLVGFRLGAVDLEGADGVFKVLLKGSPDAKVVEVAVVIVLLLADVLMELRFPNNGTD